MRRREIVLRTALIWLLLEAIAAAQVQQHEERLLWSWLRSLARPFVATASWSGDLIADLSWGVRDTRRLISDVRHLEEELAVAQARIILLEENIVELREALRFPLAIEELGVSPIIGRCIYRRLATGRLEISAGLAEGIRYDTPALSADGLVGRVVRVGIHRCWLEAITHPAAAVAVRSRDGEVIGLATGSGQGALQVLYISRQTQLLRGAELESSGADGIYPPGIPVAEVTSIRQTDDAFLEVLATPKTDFKMLRMVMLLPAWAETRQGRVPE